MNTENKKIRIIIYGKKGVGKTTLSNIIKRCLENDFEFRTSFVDAKVTIEEALQKEENSEKIEK